RIRDALRGDGPAAVRRPRRVAGIAAAVAAGIAVTLVATNVAPQQTFRFAGGPAADHRPATGSPSTSAAGAGDVDASPATRAPVTTMRESAPSARPGSASRAPTLAGPVAEAAPARPLHLATIVPRTGAHATEGDQ